MRKVFAITRARGGGLPADRRPRSHNLGRAPRHRPREPPCGIVSIRPCLQYRPSPASEVKARTGGAALVECLAAHDVPLWTCVPGESFLPVLDALWEAGIGVINTRHEAAAPTWPRRPGS